MIPFAAANRVRLILVNRRDYPGSTPLSDAELAELGSSDLETRARALARQGLDIGLFLAWLIRKENIPPVVIDRESSNARRRDRVPCTRGVIAPSSRGKRSFVAIFRILLGFPAGLTSGVKTRR